jgi:predicted nuclease of predicted toxin-antitoxin system
MTIWIDAQMPPAIAAWLSSNFAVSAVAVRDLGLRDAEDKEIFQAARRENAVVMTKDSDFVLLLDRLGAPPQLISMLNPEIVTPQYRPNVVNP